MIRTILVVCLILLLIPTSYAYEEPTSSGRWLVDKPIKNRTFPYTFYYNPTHCPSGFLNDVRMAVNRWGYTVPFPLEIVEYTGLQKGSDEYSVIGCDPYLGKNKNGKQIRGQTSITLVGDLIRSADIVINPIWMAPCTLIHEIGHALGLNHSPNLNDVMYYSCYTSTLSVNDIHTVSELYDTYPNCTPYVDEDKVVHFPYINGYTVELSPSTMIDGKLAFQVTDYRKSVGTDWYCDLYYNKTSVSTEVYYKDSILEVELRKNNNLWILERY